MKIPKKQWITMSIAALIFGFSLATVNHFIPISKEMNIVIIFAYGMIAPLFTKSKKVS